MYLLPVIGVIPAVWTLYRAKQSNALKTEEGGRNAPSPTCPALRQQYQASRLAINLMVLWLSSYGLFSLGAANASELLSLRLLYANAIATTGYFLICTFLFNPIGCKNRKNVYASMRIH